MRELGFVSGRLLLEGTATEASISGNLNELARVSGVTQGSGPGWF
jgi:hypothetical protein